MSKIFDALQGTRSETADLLTALVDGQAGEFQARNLVPAARPDTMEPEPAKAEATSPRPVDVPAVAPPLRSVKLTIPDTVPVLPFDNQNEAAAEQYRIARTKIIHHPKRPRTIAVTSPGTGDGKTTTAINIAGALSLQAAAKVLLLDADFRRSAVHSLVGLPKSPGMAEVIEGTCAFEDAAVEVEGYPNLNIITSGESHVNPSELLESSRWRAVLETLRNRYEFVVLDTPPVGVVADWDLIQMVADGIVLVFRPDHTKRGSCLRVIDSMPKEKLIGVVLNRTKPWPFSGNGGRYGYGYGNGQGYEYGAVYGSVPAQEEGRSAKRSGSKQSQGE
jgi:capsular exopolysaccharide synthesis family protein